MLIFFLIFILLTGVHLYTSLHVNSKIVVLVSIIRKENTHKQKIKDPGKCKYIT